VGTVTAQSLTAFDTTNLVLALTVPASGKIVVQCSAMSHTAVQNMHWGLLNASGGGTLAGPDMVVHSADTSYSCHTWTTYITGLTPGALTLQWACQMSGAGGTGTVYAGPLDGSAVMIAWAA
jgi:hypothetical protein